METSDVARIASEVRQVLAAYTHAVDDRRMDDLAALFCPDATVTLPGSDPVVGRAGIRALFDTPVGQTIIRHVLVNIELTGYDETSAASLSDLLVVGGDPWQIKAVGRYADTYCRHEGTWRFHSRTLQLAK